MHAPRVKYVTFVQIKAAARGQIDPSVFFPPKQRVTMRFVHALPS